MGQIVLFAPFLFRLLEAGNEPRLRARLVGECKYCNITDFFNITYDNQIFKKFVNQHFKMICSALAYKTLSKIPTTFK